MVPSSRRRPQARVTKTQATAIAKKQANKAITARAPGA